MHTIEYYKLKHCLQKIAGDDKPGFFGSLGGMAGGAFDKTKAIALLLPVIAGASAGILHSKVTSPVNTEELTQKEIVQAELDEAYAEMKRKQALAKKMADNGKQPSERSLHI